MATNTTPSGPSHVIPAQASSRPEETVASFDGSRSTVGQRRDVERPLDQSLVGHVGQFGEIYRTRALACLLLQLLGDACSSDVDVVSASNNDTVNGWMARRRGSPRVENFQKDGRWKSAFRAHHGPRVESLSVFRRDSVRKQSKTNTCTLRTRTWQELWATRRAWPPRLSSLQPATTLATQGQPGSYLERIRWDELIL